MLVKFYRSNGSFPNLLNWWRIRIGCTALDQCYWNKENWFANWKSTMHFSDLHATGSPTFLFSHWIKEKFLCTQRDSNARHQIFKLRLWPLDHSSSDLYHERERLNITYNLCYCCLSLRHFYKPECQSQKANSAGRKSPVYNDKKIQHRYVSTMPLIIEFFIKIKSQFGRFWEQRRIIILSLP